ncbi:MAG: phosphohydrolase [Clostridia bacterium]|nr:phosphohydrolase [Clostridia bacterium]
MTIFTYSGKIIDPANVRAEDIDERDITHALSQVCRATGHFKHFYSVAQHSINCMREAKARGYSERVCFAALLHDAGEAYLSDVSRPIKEKLPEYVTIENAFLKAVFEKFNLYPLSEEEWKKVAEVDDACLWYEFKMLHTIPIEYDVPPRLYSKPDLKKRSMRSVKKQFIDQIKKYTKLCGGKDNAERIKSEAQNNVFGANTDEKYRRRASDGNEGNNRAA